jgi:hypothetical protein
MKYLSVKLTLYVAVWAEEVIPTPTMAKEHRPDPSSDRLSLARLGCRPETETGGCRRRVTVRYIPVSELLGNMLDQQ